MRLNRVIVISLVVVGFLVSYTSLSHAQSNATPAATVAPTPGWNLSDSTTQDNSTNPSYTITIERPVLAGLNVDAFNAAIQKFSEAAVADFKSSIGDASGGPGNTSTLTITYTILVIPKGLLSVHFHIDSYINGAAHPLLVSYTLNYDATAGKVLALADLFQPKANYLNVIATFCTNELKREGRLTFPDGATAKAENYTNWNLDEGGLLITFDEYQVGAYVEGPSEVFIPYTTLGDILASDLPFYY